MSSSKSSSRFSLRSLKAPILLGLMCFIVYNANFRQIGAGDTIPARYLPLILWHNRTLDLDTNVRLVAQGHSDIRQRDRPKSADGKAAYFEPWAYWIATTRHGQRASLYPVVAPLIVAPLYAPAVFWLNAQGWNQPQVNRTAEIMEKLSASILASLACILMFLVLRREGNRWSFPLALAFAFGTNTWMISSQALWQHGTGELLIALALLLVTSVTSPVRMMLLGAVCVLMVANRPPDALIAAPLALFTVWNHRRNVLWLIAGAVLPLAAVLYYNVYFIGHIAGAYALGNPPDSFFQLGLSGIAGLLISPTRGLLIFTPFLILLPIGLRERLRDPNSKKLAAMLSFAVIMQMLLYSQLDWRAGVSWGPRWLTDVLPILVWMIAPVPNILRPFGRKLFILTVIASIIVQLIGAFWYTGISDERIFENPASMSGAWNPKNTPFLVELRHPRAQRELLCDAVGSLDRVGLSTPVGEIPVLKNGMQLEGWALTCGRTPAQLFVLIDGIIVGSTLNFLPRPDVNAAMHTDSPSGWRISANTQGIASGERMMQLAARIDSKSNIRILREQRVLIPEFPGASASVLPKIISTTDLDTMANRAAKSLWERQTEYGFWLTSYTGDIRYENPKPEMNTFLTAILIDSLSPVARREGLDKAIDEARSHLAAQIESNGLVRYHGLPDSPFIGKLGCAITPDSDNTALAWRITNLDIKDPRFPQMFEEITQYRNAKGLYRTWLAPRDKYRCLDPGRDPNPADIVIQMHVYMMLHKLGVSAAKDLCKAIQISFKDENAWAYYAKAPLLPYLRSAELKQLGCPVPLPAERLANLPAEQELWGEAARKLVETPLPVNTADREEIRKLLVRLGNDDFAALRRAPPLLYHNDLSATVKRYYWSEDAGYALWLRLYELAKDEAAN
jgi:hypothetical protein